MSITASIPGTAAKLLDFYTRPKNMRRKSLRLGPKDPAHNKIFELLETEVSLSLDKPAFFYCTIYLQLLSESKFFEALEVRAARDARLRNILCRLGRSFYRDGHLGI
jgi:hypothetical protein